MQSNRDFDVATERYPAKLFRLKGQGKYFILGSSNSGLLSIRRYFHN